MFYLAVFKMAAWPGDSYSFRRSSTDALSGLQGVGWPANIRWPGNGFSP